MRSTLGRSVVTLFAVGIFSLGANVAPASARTASITYSFTDVQATPTFGCTEFDCSSLTQWSYDNAGVPICSPPGASPCDGTFSWSFVVARASTTNPCRMKSGTGVLNVTWADFTTTVGSLAFKSRDSKSLSMSGIITGGSNTSLVGEAVKGTVSYTEDLCKAGLVRAMIRFA